VFAADRALSEQDRRLLTEGVESGLTAWSAHGSPVTWGYTIVHEQFLLVGVDETHTALSGCSIDAAVRHIRELERRLGMAFLDNSRVFFREGDRVRRVSRAEFRAQAESGRITGDTIVFNNVIESVGDLRRGLWEVEARHSWHGQTFPVGA
jgi:hypothetical protein